MGTFFYNLSLCLCVHILRKSVDKFSFPAGQAGVQAVTTAWLSYTVVTFAVNKGLD